MGTTLKYLGIAVGVVIAGLLIGRLTVGRPDARPDSGGPDLAARSRGSEKLRTDDAHKLALRPLPAQNKVPALKTAAGTNVEMPTLSPADANLITNWEEELDAIFAADTSDQEKVKRMFAMFPLLPEDGQVEVAQHLANLVPDEEYAPLGQMLTNSALPEEVLDVLLADVLNRPNAAKMPALLAVARDPANSKSGEARELLELFLDEDYGEDWNIWQEKVDEYLKANPE